MYLNICTLPVLLTAFLAATSLAAPTDKTPKLIHLSKPTGPKRVGVVHLELTDNARTDYFAPGAPRQIPVSVHYPALVPSGAKPQPYVSPAISQILGDTFGVPAEIFSPLRSHAITKAVPAVAPFSKVILFSPGFDSSRVAYGTVLEELASHGYVVISMDHVYDAMVVEWANGTVTYKSPGATIEKLEVGHAMYEQRVRDSLFVAKRVERIAKMAGIWTPVDSKRMGMFGHSFGGTTTHGAMIRDLNIIAGINMDGSFFDTATELDRLTDNPGQFLLMTSEGHTSAVDPTYQDWTESQHGGYAREIMMTTGGHMSYSDVGDVVDRLNARPLIPGIEQMIGSINGPRSVELMRAYVRSFFDWQLRRRSGDLLQGSGSPKYPEMVWIENKEGKEAGNAEKQTRSELEKRQRGCSWDGYYCMPH